MDGTDCPIWKTGSCWFSHKFKKPGVRYELGVLILNGDICSLNGPFACGDWPDIKKIRTGLKGCLDEGERVEADAGYIGDRKVKAPGPLYTDKKYIKMKKRAASRHETVNMRIKVFNCLTEKFRHGVPKHAICFRAVAVIVQLSIDCGEALFKVNFDDN